MKSWIQDPKTGKLVPKREYSREEGKYHYVMGDIGEFVSPVDGSVISSRGSLRAHNRRHGVTDSRDYSPEFMLKRSAERINRITGNTRADRDDRKAIIARALEGKRE